MIRPEAASATSTWLVQVPLSPGVERVKASWVPSGEKEGSVSRSRGPRPSSFIAAACVPSVSASQIRWTRCPSIVSNRVTAMRRPSGVYVCRSVHGS